MRLRSVLLAAALLPVVAACGGGDGVDKKTSCDQMKNAINSIGTLQVKENGEGADNFAEIYSGAATKIRTAANASEDANVKSAGTEVADALDELAKAQNSADPGGSPEALEASSKLATAAGSFEKHCGPVE
ncbi:hypothetical protein ABGB12_23120 [Actinocorallia sp. B10E7]|uniref:hypothetical protein n=1 Tax=Actinocorallia sp. B10E7 TaxID=3153558 RepID=UPI00325F6D47